MRWKPTRAGIFNVWEYDDQTFEFGDGRLALRGRNGSGKSNALALLFPFVLDGVMSAARMDPMGGGRSMKSLLLGRDDDDRAGRYRYDSGTGYVWMEFSSGESYLTIGIGATATQHRDAEPWFFITAQRVGHDLRLAENDTPLGRRQLEERLAEGSTFTTTADEYRAAVDRRLLGLGARRYRRLIDLLLTLRRPHLAGKLDIEHLSSTLSAGLGELDSALIEDVAHSFDDLDAMQHELEGLAASLAAVERFLPVYRDHIIGVGRQRAQTVVDTQSGVRAVEQSLATANGELTDANETNSTLAASLEEASTTRDRLDTEIETIQLSPAYQSATALAEVRRSTETAAESAGKASTTAQSSATNAQRSADAAAEARSKAEGCAQDVDATVTEWGATARAAGIDAPFSDRDLDDRWAIAVVTERREEVSQVNRLAKRAADATTDAQRAEEHERDCYVRVQDANNEGDTAVSETERQRAELAERRAAWTVQLADVVTALSRLAPDLSAPTLENLWGDPSEATELMIEAAADAEIQAFHDTDRVVGTLDAVTLRAIDAAASAVAAQERLLEELNAERERVATEPNPGPPPNPTRPDAHQEGRSGAPLYVCVDFADHLHKEARAGLEAALGAAGLLDARVTALVDSADVLDATINPGWVRSSLDPSLGDVLVPVPVEGLDAAQITTVLRSIPLDSEIVELGPDGRWRLGPLSGRFSQPEPQFIGHAAREHRRTERLAALDQTIANEHDIVSALRVRHARLLDIRANLTEARRTQPPTGSLADAVGRLRKWASVVTEREATYATAKADAATKLQLADTTSTELHRAATRLRLPTDTDALRRVDELLRDCDNHRRHLLSARTTLTIAQGALERADESSQRSRARADEDLMAAAAAEKYALAESARYEQLRSNVGGDAQRAIQALADARRRRTAIASTIQTITTSLGDNSRELATLTERIAQLDHRTTELGIELISAEQNFLVICSSEVAELLTLEGVEPGSDPRTAARRLLAATERPPGDATNRMEKAYREILLDGLRAGHDPSMPKLDGVDVVRVGTVDGDVPIGTLARELRDEHERIGQLLTKQEREIFETHLLTRVGDALRQLMLDADAFEHRINEEMAKVPTESGMVVELRWEVSGDEPGLRDPVQTLRTAPELLGPDRRDALREFLMQRIANLRNSDPGRSFAETLTAALDYRSWHDFALYARFSNGRRQRVTRTFYRGLSGGEAATLLHLPLFAAAAAQYSNGTLSGPRLIALDEAFVGIDDKMRSRLMGLLTQLDLDVILTSHEFWGFYDTVPSLVLYDLLRRPPAPGVFAQRFDWTAETHPAVS